LQRAYTKLRGALSAHFDSIKFTAPVEWLAGLASNAETLGPFPAALMVDALMSIYLTTTTINLKPADKQQCEGNMDLSVALPAVFNFFKEAPGQVQHMILVYKERMHAAYHKRETGKHVGSTGPLDDKSVTKASKLARTIKADQVLETANSDADNRFALAVGETAQSFQQRKYDQDTQKCHKCSKAELSLLALNTAEAIQELAKTAFVFSCVCTGEEVELYSYRVTAGFVKTVKLVTFSVPIHVASFKTTKWDKVLEGFLTALQLKHWAAKQAQQLRENAFKNVSIAQAAGSLLYTPAHGPTDSAQPQEEPQEKKGPSIEYSLRSTRSSRRAKKSPSGQSRDGLATQTLRFVVQRQLERDENTRVFFGYASQPGQAAFYLVIKYIGRNHFYDEARLHQTAFSLAPEGVLPLWAWTDSKAAIQALGLPGLPTSRAELMAVGGGVLLMPQAEEWLYPVDRPLRFLEQVVSELCPTLQALADAGLYHNDVRRSNVLVYQGRLCLMDFGFASWKQDCLNRRGLVCGKHYMQGPELLEESTFIGTPGEAQLVFTLGSLIQDGILFDLDDMDRTEMSARSLLYGLKAMVPGMLPQVDMDMQEDEPIKLNATWQLGLALVVPLLDACMAFPEQARPRLADATARLDCVLSEWYEALEGGGESKAAAHEVEDQTDLPQAAPPSQGESLPVRRRSKRAAQTRS
jgi:hypothetical protein